MGALRRQGCRIQALVSAAAPDVVATLLESGISVRSASLDVDGDVSTGFEDSGWEHFPHFDDVWDHHSRELVPTSGRS
jgi:hypothetical protein